MICEMTFQRIFIRLLNNEMILARCISYMYIYTYICNERFKSLNYPYYE